MAIERDVFADNLWIASKAGTPEAVGQQGGARRLRVVLFASEIAAQNRLNAEGGKKRGVRLTATQARRILLG